MAAGATYVPIATYTASGSTTTITFSSIPQTYTDLRIISNLVFSGQIYLQFNGDTGGNYSITYVQGTGSSASSGRTTNQTNGMQMGYGVSSNLTVFTADIFNYANTTTYKTALSRDSDAGGLAQASVGLWRNTSNITSIAVYSPGANYSSTSTFTLYGIASA